MRYICLSLEIVACVVIMRSLNLAYDGVVLLVVADLLHRYSGRHQLILLTVAMLGLYAIVDYNIVSLEYHIAPFNAYAAYYAAGPRAWILTLHNAFVSLNLILFVFYLTLLIRQNHQEKQRIASLNAQLEEANTRLRAYAIEAEAMAETRERNRLAREIHDTLGHALTGIAAGLDATSFLVDIAPDKAKEQLSKIKETALRGLKDVRRSVRKLRPDDLEQLPLHQAIEHMIDDFSASTGMKIDFEILQWPERLRPDQEEVLYRIVQEGMTNARRHGHAHHLTITIGTRRGIIYLLLADDGQGADIRRLQKASACATCRNAWLCCTANSATGATAALPLSHYARKRGGIKILMTKKIQIMIADDQELIRESLSIVLSANTDMEVTGLASNGRELLELIKNSKKAPPDVVLMDVRMPELDGVEATHAVKEQWPQVRIIILTTFDDDEYVFNALKYGASGYLLKGVSVPELSSAIRTVAQGGAMINPAS